MELDFAVLADGASPRPDGKLDLFGAGIDTILTAAVPARHAHLVFAARIRMSVAEASEPHRLTMLLHSSEGAEIATGEAALEALSPSPALAPPRAVETTVGVSLILNLDGLVFPEFGEYQVQVRWDETEIRSLPLMILRPPAP